MTTVSSFYAGRRVLITGGLGFIGSNLAIRLVELGADVLLVDSMLPAYGADLEPTSSRSWIGAHQLLRRARPAQSGLPGPGRQDLIFSLAGQVSHSESMRDPMTDLEINCKQPALAARVLPHGTTPASRSSSPARASSTGGPQYLPVDEKHPLVPVDVNGINNLAAEMYYTLYHEVHGMPTVSLRLTNTYGPRMDLREQQEGVRRHLRAPGAWPASRSVCSATGNSAATSTTSTTSSTRLLVAGDRVDRTRSTTSATPSRRACSSS